MTERSVRRPRTAGPPPSCLRAPMIPQPEQEPGAWNVMDRGLRATCRGRGPSRSVSWTGTLAPHVTDRDPRAHVIPRAGTHQEGSVYEAGGPRNPRGAAGGNSKPGGEALRGKIGLSREAAGNPRGSPLPARLR